MGQAIRALESDPTSTIKSMNVEIPAVVGIRGSGPLDQNPELFDCVARFSNINTIFVKVIRFASQKSSNG